MNIIFVVHLLLFFIPKVPSNKKIDQLKAILGLTTHGTGCTQLEGEQTAEPSKSAIMTSRSYPSSFDQASSSASEAWITDRPSLTGYVLPEPKRARLSPTVSEVLDLASTPVGHRVHVALQNALDSSTINIETHPDPLPP